MLAISRAQVREVDRMAMEDFSVPGIVLMENAGRNASEAIIDMFDSVSKKVVSTSIKRNLLTGSAEDNVYMLVLFTSERGLCGGFNSSITKAVREKIELLKNLEIQLYQLQY